MRIAKGFKGRYFSLAAITATSSQSTLHARITAFCNFFVFKSPKEDKDDEAQESPPELLEIELQQKPCYLLCGQNPLRCNCIFRRKTRLTLLNSKLKKKAPCRCRFRKTGLAPPCLQLFKKKKQTNQTRKTMKKQLLSLAAISALTANVSLNAQEIPNPESLSITVKADHKSYDEMQATKAYEIFTASDMERVGSKNIYDFLNQHSTISFSPSYGNPFSQQISLRGFGNDGYQNIVVKINGQRLNNVDMSPQLLSQIPLDAIEQIEISKGSGSVTAGDGATSGVINIVTKSYEGLKFHESIGTYNYQKSALSAGYKSDTFALSGYLNRESSDGERKSTTGKKTDNYQRSYLIDLSLRPLDRLELRAGTSGSDVNVKYGGYITKAEFDDDASLASSITEQEESTKTFKYGAGYQINDQWGVEADIYDEIKNVEFVTWGSSIDKNYQTVDSKTIYKGGFGSASLGFQKFSGNRENDSDTTSKDSNAYYIDTKIDLNRLLFSLGYRNENIEYGYNPVSGTTLSKDINENAYDIGTSFSVNNSLALFANYNRAFQAPDIDRFFSGGWGGTPVVFNEFIDPMIVKTLNIGLRHASANNKLKITLFNSALTNEIYYDGSNNTNIDRSSKKGLELFDKYRVNGNLYTMLNYAYVDAKIDKEKPVYEGKTLPGVSNHSLTFGVGYLPYKTLLIEATHKYRSEAYAANDFENSFSQKQSAYHVTELSASYRYKTIKTFARIQNLFENRNGVWISDDVIYPIDFQRKINIGVEAEF